jgi:hypothetical protein
VQAWYEPVLLVADEESAVGKGEEPSCFSSPSGCCISFVFDRVDKPRSADSCIKG